MYLAIIVLPLLGSIVSGFLGRKVGISGAQMITTFCVMLTTVFATITFFEVGLNNLPVSLPTVYLNRFRIIKCILRV